MPISSESLIWPAPITSRMYAPEKYNLTAVLLWKVHTHGTTNFMKTHIKFTSLYYLCVPRNYENIHPFIVVQ